MSSMIPFNRATIAQRQLEYVGEAFGYQVSGDGPFTHRAEAILRTSINEQSRALLTTSCTHALEMSALLLEIQPGDEVIVPAFTFVSSINAFVMRGAKPIFCDVRPDTLNLDERILPKLITSRTKAVVVVHYAGVGCEMDAIDEITRSHGIAVVEDNAHGLMGRYKGRPLGSFGALATQSFHETKNISCGEGGALIVNDARYVERAEILREKGTNRSKFFRGQVDKYTWVDLGSSWVLSEILAATLVAQLEDRERIQQRRASVWKRYRDELAAWGPSVGATLPVIPQHCDQAFHMFYLIMPTLDVRTAFIDHVKRDGALPVFHYQPLHRSPMARQLGVRADCPVTERVADCLVRLPLFADLNPADQSRIIESVLRFQ